MAIRKTTGKTANNSNSHGPQAVVIFWLVFVIIIIVVFMLNADTIERNFNLLKTRLAAPPGTEEKLPPDDEIPSENEVTEQPPIAAIEPASRPQAEQEKPQTAQQAAEPKTETQASTQTQPPVQTRERTVYFAQINKDGQILQSKVTRRIPVSDSPMTDALNALFAGPSADELNRDIINLIPKNTRILSARVLGSTAYINFSEDFLFNTFGVEGYVAQLRQVVWTVTEFSNVNDVQFLIEGRRLDYLGEGIWIGSPISRQSF